MFVYLCFTWPYTTKMNDDVEKTSYLLTETDHGTTQPGQLVGMADVFICPSLDHIPSK